MHCWTFSISGLIPLNVSKHTSGIGTTETNPLLTPHTLQKDDASWVFKPIGLNQSVFTLELNYICVDFFSPIGLEGGEELSNTEVLLSRK